MLSGEMVKILRKIRNIFIGWYRKIFNKQSPLAYNRQQICKRCSHKETILGMEYCNICGCEIIAHSLVEEEHCYDNRW